MLKGFKDFILRGNVVQLSVAVVIGAAFTAIVTAVTNNLVYPLIAVVGNPEIGGLAIQLTEDEATRIDIGAILTAAVNFLLVAAVVYFAIVMPMNKLLAVQQRRQGVTADAAVPTDTELLTEIRDLLRAQHAATQNVSSPNTSSPDHPQVQDLGR